MKTNTRSKLLTTLGITGVIAATAVSSYIGFQSGKETGVEIGRKETIAQIYDIEKKLRSKGAEYSTNNEHWKANGYFSLANDLIDLSSFLNGVEDSRKHLFDSAENKFRSQGENSQ